MRVWTLLAGAALMGAGGVLAYAGLITYGLPGPLPTAENVVVPRGDTEAVAQVLQHNGVVRHAWMVRAAAAASAWQGRLHFGEFAFPAHASLRQVLAILRDGRPVIHLLTIPEGLTAWRIGEVLAGVRVLTDDVMLPPEGGVLPETYAYQWGTTRLSVLGRAGRAMEQTVARIWRERDTGLALRSPRELVILASLVERETHLGLERPLVARVFLNRLSIGMRLQSDPTVVYGESGGRGELPVALGREALERPGPYNTYENAGLPPGPICAPGTASLLATAHPARSNALYFVADGTGGHAFAASLSEHEHNVARYRSLSR